MRNTLIVVALIVVVIAGGAVTNAYLQNHYSAAGTVTDYLDALGRSDAGAARADLDESHARPEIVTIRATLTANSGELPRDPHILRTTTSNDGTTTVAVRFNQGAATQNVRFTLRRIPHARLLLYPNWRITNGTADLDVVPPRGSTAQLSVNHQTFTATPLPVLAGFKYTATLPDSRLVHGDTEPADIPWGSHDSQIALNYRQVTPSASQGALAAVGTYIAKCVPATSTIASDTCPLDDANVIHEAPPTQVHWSLNAGPTIGAAVTYYDGTLVVRGIENLSVNYLDTASSITSPRTDDLTYKYVAEVEAAGGTFTVTTISIDSSP